MAMSMVRIFLFCLLVFSSCTTRDDAFYLRKGEELKIQLLFELKQVNSLHDLFERQETLTFLFDEIAHLAIEADSSHKTVKHSTNSIDAVSPEINAELRRVLLIPGARAFFEKCQAKGLESMDRYVKTKKPRNRFNRPGS
jgi:hypothetical protein